MDGHCVDDWLMSNVIVYTTHKYPLFPIFPLVNIVFTWQERHRVMPIRCPINRNDCNVGGDDDDDDGCNNEGEGNNVFITIIIGVFFCTVIRGIPTVLQHTTKIVF